MFKIKKSCKSFTIVEVLLVIFLISLIYLSFINSGFIYNPKSKLITNDNICFELKKLIDKPTDEIRLIIYENKDRKLEHILTKNGKSVENNKRFKIDFENIFELDRYNELKEKSYGVYIKENIQRDILYEFNIYKNRFCSKFIYKKNEKFYIQYPFDNKPKLFDIDKLYKG
ncbi:MAG: hypothetical protein B1H07_03545 [Campylobacteraceae bacterium 4484_166]|nr:MAG: hypothetical protein B1H07_03545 [Campylobacteraceae bacterium 4484_166]